MVGYTSDLSPFRRCFGHGPTDRILHPEAPAHRPQHDPGPQRSEGVHGGGEAPRHPNLFVLGGAGQDRAGTAGVR